MRSALENEIKKLEEKMTLMEIYNRKMNLLFYGVQEQKDENIFETLQNVFDKLGMDDGRARNIKFANAHRLPARRDTGRPEEPQRPPRPSPIIVKFLSMTDRDEVLSAFEQQQRQLERRRTSERHPHLLSL